MTESLPASNPREKVKIISPRFEEVYRREFAYVFQTLRRLGVRSSDLADVTHDVFLSVFRHVENYDPSRALRPWLFGFAFRVASDYRKKARNRYTEVPAEEGELDANGPHPEEDAQASELRRDLLRALDSMDFDKRALVVMHDIDGQTVPEMATFFDITLNTMYSRLRLARAELESRLRGIRGESQ